MTAPTAREQFVTDFTMVTDNDSDYFTQAMETVDKYNGVMHAVSDELRHGYEMAIESALMILKGQDFHAFTIDIMRELLQGWGTDVFDDIARHYIEKANER